MVRAMTELSEKVKTALDETRILILGSQILVGFQFRSVFEDAFNRLPSFSRAMNGVALILMLIAIALLIAPSMHHEIVEDGRDDGRVHRVISWMAGFALLPFALSIGLDLFIVIDRIYGLPSAVVAGVAFGGLALFLWYGLGFFRRDKTRRKERAVVNDHRDEIAPTPLHTKIEQMLTEARVILPGAQALLGFQLAIIITRAFDDLPASAKLTHVVSLGFTAVTTILLMTPAAYHRIAYAGEDSEDVYRCGSIMVTAATLPLALGLGCDVYVVIAKIAESALAGALVATLATAGFIALWHVWPALTRYRLAKRKSSRNTAGHSPAA
jgi:hypothetical protein